MHPRTQHSCLAKMNRHMASFLKHNAPKHVPETWCFRQPHESVLEASCNFMFSYGSCLIISLEMESSGPAALLGHLGLCLKYEVNGYFRYSLYFCVMSISFCSVLHYNVSCFPIVSSVSTFVTTLLHTIHPPRQVSVFPEITRHEQLCQWPPLWYSFSGIKTWE